MLYATASDVAIRLGRELTTEEVSLVDIRLDDVERRILRRIPDLDEKITAGEVDEADVVQVEADVVVRLVRNPDGYLAETDGNSTYMFRQDLPTGSSRSWPQSGRRSVSYPVPWRSSCTTDEDGNTRTRPSATGVVCRAVVQPITSAVAVGNQESQEIGFVTESKYRLRLVGFPTLLGPQSQIEWQGKRYAIEGEPPSTTGLVAQAISTT